MEELAIMFLGFLFAGPSKPKSDDTTGKPKTDDDTSKLPDDTKPTTSAPNWSGDAGGVIKSGFWVRRQKAGWVSHVDGVGVNTHATAYLALHAAVIGALAMAAQGSGVQVTATPYVFDGLVTHDGATWRWYVKLPAEGATLITGKNDALANGSSDSEDGAIDQILSWARPVTEGKRPG